MREDLLEGLPEELFEKARSCKSNEELFALAKEEGLELNETQLEAVSGGGCTQPQAPAPGPSVSCPRCGATDVERITDTSDSSYGFMVCPHCNCHW